MSKESLIASSFGGGISSQANILPKCIVDAFHSEKVRVKVAETSPSYLTRSSISHQLIALPIIGAIEVMASKLVPGSLRALVYRPSSWSRKHPTDVYLGRPRLRIHRKIPSFRFYRSSCCHLRWVRQRDTGWSCPIAQTSYRP